VQRLVEQYEGQGYRVTREHAVPGDGFVDVLAEDDRQRIAIEVETGQSDVRENLNKLAGAGFDRIVLVATSPAGIAACQRAIDRSANETGPTVELRTWLDVS
jgi:predicted RecB family endonuclease